MKFKSNYGNEILNKAYEKFFAGERMSYEEFVIMLSTNDELYFFYNDREYLFEHTSKEFISMCVTSFEDGVPILERNEQFDSIIDALLNFRIDEKTIYEVWSNVWFPKPK